MNGTTDDIIHAFLQQTRDQVPERVYVRIRREIDDSPQRIVVARWRTPFTSNMSAFPVSALVVALLAILAVASLNVLGLTVASPPGATPTAPAASPGALTPDSSVTVLAAKDRGTSLAPGRYSVSIPDRVTYTFSLGDGWIFDDVGSGRVQFSRKQPDSDEPVSVLFISAVKSVFADPCMATGGQPSAVDQSVAAIVTALTSQIGLEASEPQPVQLDGATGSTFIIHNRIVPSGKCPNNIAVRQWRDTSDFDVEFTGMIEQQLWVVDVGRGAPLVVALSTFPQATASDRQAAGDVVATMSFR